jgi:hypothetical protein
MALWSRMRSLGSAQKTQIVFPADDASWRIRDRSFASFPAGNFFAFPDLRRMVVVMAEVEAVLAEALEDMRAGRERTVPDYLKLVPEADREELATLLSVFYLHHSAAAGPDVTDAERLKDALALVDRYFNEAEIAGPLSAVLVELRKSRRLRRGQVVDWLADRFQVKGAGEGALARAYHRLEIGQISGTELSGSLLSALGEYFKVNADDLAAAASQMSKVPVREAPLFARGSKAIGESRARPDEPGSLTEGDAGERVVERLFFGGPDA